MKMSFVAFWRRNQAFAKLAVISNLEYRFNFLIDAMVQPCITAVVEIVLWMAIFKGSGATLISGYAQESYLAYALWATFVTRITTNWMYEFKMISEIEEGTINGVLVRPDRKSVV